MIYMGITFTANMRFGYLPSEDEIVNYGYIPLYEILAKFPQFKANLCFSGYSELTLAKKYPKVVDMVKKVYQKAGFVFLLMVLNIFLCHLFLMNVQTKIF